MVAAITLLQGVVKKPLSVGGGANVCPGVRSEIGRTRRCSFGLISRHRKLESSRSSIAKNRLKKEVH